MPERTRVAGVDVGLTPTEVPSGEIAVVIDVLRATSTILQALESGYQRVLCCGSLDAAREPPRPRDPRPGFPAALAQTSPYRYYPISKA